MRSVNKVIIIGNLTRDPEIRETSNNQMVVTFSIATNRDWVTRDGRKQSFTEYHEVVAWAKLAEISSKYLKKGKLVYVEGYLKTRNFDTPEGIKKFKTEIVVQDLIMLDKRTSEENDGYIAEESDVLPQVSAKMDTSEPVKFVEKKPKTEEKINTSPVTTAPEEIDIDKDLGL